MRWCKKVGCAQEAAATCSFNYASQQVWITELRDEPDPATQDLCQPHADRFIAPLGWELQDLRAGRAVLEFPDAAAIA